MANNILVQFSQVVWYMHTHEMLKCSWDGELVPQVISATQSWAQPKQMIW